MSVFLGNPFKERAQADRLARIGLWGAFVISVAHKAPVMRYQGQCHCGATRIEFETNKLLAPRACQCSFCRKHGARTVSDPDGSATLTLGASVIRYRFATKSSDYVLCATCGVYVGAVAEVEGATYATLNLNAFDDPRLDFVAEPVSYDGEDAAAKGDRRRARWTPVSVCESWP